MTIPVVIWDLPLLRKRKQRREYDDWRNTAFYFNVMNEYKSPVYKVIAVPVEKVVAK